MEFGSMKKNLVIGITFMLLWLAASILAAIDQWLWARILGILSLILFLFGIWKKESKGFSTLIVCLLFIIYVWVMLWLIPAGIVTDPVFALLTTVVVLSGACERYIHGAYEKKH